MQKEGGRFAGWGVGGPRGTKPISFLPTPEIEQALRGLPDRSAQIRAWVRVGLARLTSADRRRPETPLQTLSTLNPKECSLEINGTLHTGTIAAVLVDWKTGKVKAVLINTVTGQVQVPIAKITILSS
jgi:hypothetical protein